jgi:hypothetical protein
MRGGIASLGALGGLVRRDGKEEEGGREGGEESSCLSLFILFYLFTFFFSFHTHDE